MKRKDFNALRERTIAGIFGLNDAKGADYAGDDDALGNFKDAAAQLGVTPELIWGVYAHKHWSAVMSFCKKGQVESEPVESRIHDIMVYCLLLLGLIEDRKAAEAPTHEQRGTTVGEAYHGAPQRSPYGGDVAGPPIVTDPRRGER